MKRNILAAVIAFLLFIPMPLNVIPVKASCSQYVQDMIFSADFNENPNAVIELSPGDNADYGLYYLQRTQTTNYTSSARFQENRLVMSATQGSGNVEIVWFNDVIPSADGNYTIEADLCYVTDPGSRYLGLMYRVQDELNFQKAYVTPVKASANGQVNGSWYNDVPGYNKFDYSSGVTAGVPFKMKVVLNGTNATLYYAIYDDYENKIIGDYTCVMTINNIPTSQLTGSYGFLISGCTAWIDNITVTLNADGSVIFEEDFNLFDEHEKLFLSSGLNENVGMYYHQSSQTSGYQSSAYVDYGKLYIKATAGSSKVDKVYFTNLLDEGDYIIEADLCYVTDPGSRYLGLMYRVQDGLNFQKAYVTPVKASANGQVNGSWYNDVPGYNKFDYSSGVTVGVPFRIKVVLKGNTAALYYAIYTDYENRVIPDYTYITTISNIPESQMRGGVGFLVSGCTAWIDNIEVHSYNEIEEDFSSILPSTGLPEHWNIVPGSTGVSVQGGKLEIYAASGFSAVECTLPTLRNYQMEVDISLDDGSTGWAGITFRNRTLAGWNNAYISLGNSAGFCSYTNNYPYSVTSPVAITASNGSFTTLASDSKTIVPSQTYHLKLMVENRRATLYVNGTLVTDCTLSSNWDAGGLGLAAQNCKAVFDNLTFTGFTPDVLPPAVMASNYIPDTGIINPPTVIAYIDSAAEYNNLSAVRLPAVALFHIDAGLNVMAGSTILGSIGDMMDLIEGTSIPAVIVDSTIEANALAAYFNERCMVDAFVVAAQANADLVKAVREECPNIRGAIWLDQVPESLSAKKAAQYIANNHLANVILVPGSLSVEEMDYFNRRSITVWCETDDDQAGIYRAVSSGYNGVIVSDFEMVYDVYESITAVTVSGKPVVVAHRGHTSYPENSILSFQQAMANDVRIIETDLRLSSDGEIVLMHDSTVDRTTNGTGSVSNMTVAQLKELTIDNVGGYNEKVPTLIELFSEFQGTDMVFLLHINVANQTLCTRLAQLIDYYDIASQVIVFARSNYHIFNPANIPDVSFVGGVNSPFSTVTDPMDAIEQLAVSNSPYNYMPLPISTTAYTDYVGTGWDFCYQLRNRGFLPWVSTTNNRTTLNNTLMLRDGFFAALTDHISYAYDYAYIIDAQDMNVQLGDPIELTHTLMNLNSNYNTQVTCGFVHLGGAAIDGNGITLQAGNATVVFYYDITGRHASGYRVYSSPVNVTIE